MADLPDQIEKWFDQNGWAPHPHQIELFEHRAKRASLLIAPTGAGKTLSGFLPTLCDFIDETPKGLHTIYVSPLKALANDIKRNLTRPIEEMNLSLRVEDRTGDTSQKMRKAQRVDPPHILLTTPESLALLISYPEAPKIFETAQRVIVDEIHALAESKRGDQLMLCLARIEELAPKIRRVGLSATVDRPSDIAHFLSPTGCKVLYARSGPPPQITMLKTRTPPPWAGAGAVYSVPDVLEEIKNHRTSLIFHNTRAQAEIFYHALWMANSDNLPIAIHHGSLDKTQRARVEAAMAAGSLRAVVCTGTLDLGIDWGDVDLVMQIGAPKNIKRLVQRIGRANHSFNVPSKAMIVPANHFEIIECHAALHAVREGNLDGTPRGAGPLDVLCQHILIMAAHGPFNADTLYTQVTLAGPYAGLSRADFDACLEYCATGGYALSAYDRYQRLVERDGLWSLRDPRQGAHIRMNIGTIQDRDLIKVRMKGNPKAGLGEIEEGFAATLREGDTFLIGGRVVRYERLKEMFVEVSRSRGKEPKIATFAGTKFATSTQLSKGILDLLHSGDWSMLPPETQHWLTLQTQISELPQHDHILVETFARQERHYCVAYGFAGRNAMQTLGLLLVAEMERRGLNPVGFVATDYAVMIWSLNAVTEPEALFNSARLSEGFETWLSGTAVMKRTFRAVAQVACLIERVSKTGRRHGKQTQFSSDILYDTLSKYDPDHLLLRMTRTEAMHGLVDFERIEEMLIRTKGKIIHRDIARVSPMAAPLFLEAGRIPVEGQAQEQLLAQEAERLMQEAGL